MSFHLGPKHKNTSSSPEADVAPQQKGPITKGLDLSSEKSGINGLLYLQRTLGNQAVQRLFHQDAFQQDIKQTSIGAAVLQAKPFPGNAATVGESDQDTIRSIPQSVGRPLDTATKQALERGFDTNLDSVRVHDDSSSHSFVRSRRAYAVTFGQNIYLGHGISRPNSQDISHTLAHEVAHTIQQRNATSTGRIGGLEQYQNLERQADVAATRALRGQPNTVPPSVGSTMEQAQGEVGEPSPAVRNEEVFALITKVIRPEARAILMTHPPTYRRVVQQLIAWDADWITDKLLEVWVDDDDEAEIIRRIRYWAMTPKIEGGNYLDELLDAIRGYRYRFEYGVTESAWGSLLDKLYTEMEGDNYSALNSIVDNFSFKYAGYRGRGSFGRFTGIRTAVMPSELRDRLSRINQRLAGRITIPMTQEEVTEINIQYLLLRIQTYGLIDMPEISIGPAPGQQAGPLAIPAAAVTAMLWALILAILYVLYYANIDKITRTFERALDRFEYSGPEPSTPPTVPWSPPARPVPPPPAPDGVPVRPPAPDGVPVRPPAPEAPPTPAPRPPIPVPEAPPTPRLGPEPRPAPETGPGVDIIPPLPDPEERERRGQVILYAFGSATAPREPRENIDITPDQYGYVGPEWPPVVSGASTLANPYAGPRPTGDYHGVPRDVIPIHTGGHLHWMEDGGIRHMPTHHTIYPTLKMLFVEYVRLFMNLPWTWAGYKPKPPKPKKK